MKTISIIIPCYNCEPTLERCMQSVLSQTYANKEVILVDDGSTDGTENLSKKYCQEYDFVKYFKLEHGGVSVARNYALSVASGEYIQFIDSDDNFLSPDVLSTAVNVIESKNVDLCVYNFTHPVFETFLPGGLYDLTDKKTFMKYYQDFFTSMMPWNKLFKRELLTEKYVTGLAFAEDEIFNLANLKNVKKVFVLSDVFYNYYCAAPNNQDKSRISAINQSFTEDFTKTQNTIWYKGRRNCSHRLEILERDYPELKDQMLTTRLFDFFFWNLEFIGHLNAAGEMLATEVKRIFNEEDFAYAIGYKENFGLKFKRAMINDQNQLTNFAKTALKAYRLMKSSDLGLNVYFVLMNIFAKFFCEYDTEKLDSSDVFASAIRDYELGESKESVFTKNILIGAYND